MLTYFLLGSFKVKQRCYTRALLFFFYCFQPEGIARLRRLLQRHTQTQTQKHIRFESCFFFSLSWCACLKDKGKRNTTLHCPPPFLSISLCPSFFSLSCATLTLITLYIYTPGKLTDFLVYNVDCILPCPRYTRTLFFFSFITPRQTHLNSHDRSDKGLGRSLPEPRPPP